MNTLNVMFVSKGILHGSILGPVLFVIYLNGSLKYLTESIMFIDDRSLSVTDNKNEVLENKTNLLLLVC